MNLSDEQRSVTLIDRLVDDELAGDERRQLLAALEAQPDGWQRCALAFIEAQTWRREMRGLLSREEPKAPAATAVALARSPIGAQKTPRRFHGGTWLAAAASVVVAFGLGRQSGVERAQQDARSRSIASAPQPPPAARGDAVTLVVNDRRGVPQRIEVPLVEGRQLGQAFGDVPHWSASPELNRRLDEQGLDLTARRRYAPMYFEQESKVVPMVVPVDDAVVTPVNRPVY